MHNIASKNNSNKLITWNKSESIDRRLNKFIISFKKIKLDKNKHVAVNKKSIFIFICNILTKYK